MKNWSSRDREKNFNFAILDNRQIWICGVIYLYI